VEGRVGNGKIIISTADLLHDPNQRLEISQMKKSLLHYMNSQAFSPKNNLDKTRLRDLFR